MKKTELGLIKLGKKSIIDYKCKHCGGCCRNINKQVMLDSKDIFELVSFLSRNDVVKRSIEDVIFKYVDIIPLTESGFPILTLKTDTNGDCIFLTGNACSVYESRSRTCKMYPITINVSDKIFEYYLCTDRNNHFGSGKTRVKDYIKANFKNADQEFLLYEFEITAEIGQIYNELAEKHRANALMMILEKRYFDFDLSKPFLPQYKANMKSLAEYLQILKTKS